MSLLLKHPFSYGTLTMLLEIKNIRLSKNWRFHLFHNWNIRFWNIRFWRVSWALVDPFWPHHLMQTWASATRPEACGSDRAAEERGETPLSEPLSQVLNRQSWRLQDLVEGMQIGLLYKYHSPIPNVNFRSLLSQRFSNGGKYIPLVTHQSFSVAIWRCWEIEILK